MSSTALILAVLCSSPASGGTSMASALSAEISAGAPRVRSDRSDQLRDILEEHAPGWSERELDTVAQTVDETARISGIDPHLVLGMMYAESTFDPDAASTKGARGLLQVMPSTARAFAARAGVEWQGPETLSDLEANIRIGVTYFGYLLRKFRGDVDLALAAYCHGPARIYELLRAHGRLPDDAAAYAARVQQRRRLLQASSWAPAA